MNKLVTKPSVFVIGKSEFDEDGLNAWIKHRGFEENEAFLFSPLKNIRDAAPEGDRAELIPELAGRFCYNSMMKGRPSHEYIENILDQRHGSVLEHTTYNLAIEGVSRSLAMELIRHRAGFAISQESQRFVDAKDINFVVPPMMLHVWDGNLNCREAARFLEHNLACLEEYQTWQEYIMSELERTSDPTINTLLKKRANEAARSVLPNCAETRLVWTGNLRALRHFCELRGGKFADLEIRRLAATITNIMLDRVPYTFADFKVYEGDFGVPFVTCEASKV